MAKPITELFPDQFESVTRANRIYDYPADAAKMSNFEFYVCV